MAAPLPTAVATSAPADGDFGRQAGETRGDFLRREFGALKPFVIISLSYLLYTTTDGAIRMIVLLHAYNLGFTAWEVRSACNHCCVFLTCAAAPCFPVLTRMHKRIGGHHVFPL